MHMLIFYVIIKLFERYEIKLYKKGDSQNEHNHSIY
jgi:hypothetical protein